MRVCGRGRGGPSVRCDFWLTTCSLPSPKSGKGGHCGPPSPHHLACGFALGGSSKRSKVAPELFEREQSLLLQPVVGHRVAHGGCLGQIESKGSGLVLTLLFCPFCLQRQLGAVGPSGVLEVDRDQSSRLRRHDPGSHLPRVVCRTGWSGSTRPLTSPEIQRRLCHCKESTRRARLLSDRPGHPPKARRTQSALPE